MGGNDISNEQRIYEGRSKDVQIDGYSQSHKDKGGGMDIWIGTIMQGYKKKNSKTWTVMGTTCFAPYIRIRQKNVMNRWGRMSDNVDESKHKHI